MRRRGRWDSLGTRLPEGRGDALRVDTEKAAANLAKHGVAFDEAATVFDDPYFLVFEDPDHSIGEYRYLIIGRSEGRRLLLAAYTERGDVIRVISAREATRRERKAYEEER